MGAIRTVRAYFTLRRPTQVSLAWGRGTLAAEARRDAAWTAVLYAAVVLGVLARRATETGGLSLEGLDFGQFVAACVTGAVIFPLVYRKLGLSDRDPVVIELFVAFQNGFFSDAIVSGLRVVAATVVP